MKKTDIEYIWTKLLPGNCIYNTNKYKGINIEMIVLSHNRPEIFVLNNLIFTFSNITRTANLGDIWVS